MSAAIDDAAPYEQQNIYRKYLLWQWFRFFSELRKSTVYLLIIKKEDCVSQNMVLWAKAVCLCSLEQPSVALHLRPIILHRFSKTDKSCKIQS